MFNTITYQKGSRVLHLLRSILGDDAFFEGVKNYLSKHAYSNAEIDDLRKEFEQVSKDRFGSGWAWLILTKTNNDDDRRHRYSTTARAGDANAGGVKKNGRGIITGDTIAGSIWFTSASMYVGLEDYTYIPPN
jgi:hypothetical protein